jgi:hypothetical protein
LSRGGGVEAVRSGGKGLQQWTFIVQEQQQRKKQVLLVWVGVTRVKSSHASGATPRAVPAAAGLPYAADPGAWLSGQPKSQVKSHGQLIHDLLLCACCIVLLLML